MTLVKADAVKDLPMISGARRDAEVEFALQWASSAVESYCERRFAYQHDDRIRVDPRFGHLDSMPAIMPMSSYASYPGYGVSFSSYGSPYVGKALLPDPPVTNVSKVEALLPNVVGAPHPLEWTELTAFNWAPDGLIWDTSGMPGVRQDASIPHPSWPWMPRSLRITYSHGFKLPDQDNIDDDDVEPLPNAVRAAIIKAAAAILVNPAGLLKQKTGDVSNEFSDASAAGAMGTPPISGILDEVLLGRYRLVGL